MDTHQEIKELLYMYKYYKEAQTDNDFFSLNSYWKDLLLNQLKGLIEYKKAKIKKMFQEKIYG